MKILVIGGGMAGLTYAIVAAKNGYDVTVAERNPRLGKKISMTGNGKCNIGNANVNASCYNKSAIVSNVLNKISVDEYVKFLYSCGIVTYADNEGRMYPLSDSANGVVDCLREQLEKYGGKTVCGVEASNCRKVGDRYEVRIGGGKYIFDKVVLACGSRSQSLDVNPYTVVSQNMFTPLVPSLTPVKVFNMDGVLNGIRVKADVTLLDGALTLGKQSGEVLFKDYGLSGICIFNLSSIIARKQVQRKNGNYIFSVDLVPSMSQWDLGELLYTRIKAGYERSKLFYGILHNKVAEIVLKRAGGDVSDVSKLSETAKNLQFEFYKLLDYSMSQVTSGGIDDRYIDTDTLSLPDGIVALGEVLNVDGICGGNNLYFAAASALYTFSETERAIAYKKL